MSTEKVTAEFEQKITAETAQAVANIERLIAAEKRLVAEEYRLKAVQDARARHGTAGMDEQGVRLLRFARQQIKGGGLDSPLDGFNTAEVMNAYKARDARMRAERERAERPFMELGFNKAGMIRAGVAGGVGGAVIENIANALPGAMAKLRDETVPFNQRLAELRQTMVESIPVVGGFIGSLRRAYEDLRFGEERDALRRQIGGIERQGQIDRQMMGIEGNLSPMRADLAGERTRADVAVDIANRSRRQTPNYGIRAIMGGLTDPEKYLGELREAGFTRDQIAGEAAGGRASLASLQGDYTARQRQIDELTKQYERARYEKNRDEFQMDNAGKARIESVGRFGGVGGFISSSLQEDREKENLAKLRAVHEAKIKEIEEKRAALLSQQKDAFNSIKEQRVKVAELEAASSRASLDYQKKRIELVQRAASKESGQAEGWGAMSIEDKFGILQAGQQAKAGGWESLSDEQKAMLRGSNISGDFAREEGIKSARNDPMYKQYMELFGQQDKAAVEGDARKIMIDLGNIPIEVIGRMDDAQIRESLRLYKEGMISQFKKIAEDQAKAEVGLAESARKAQAYMSGR